MIRRDYTQEIGLDSPEKKVPWPVALIALAAVVAGFWFATSTRHSDTAHGGSGTTAAAHASSTEPRR